MPWNMKVIELLMLGFKLGTVPLKDLKRTGRIGNQRKNQDHPNFNILENGQNTEKSPDKEFLINYVGSRFLLLM